MTRRTMVPVGMVLMVLFLAGSGPANGEKTGKENMNDEAFYPVAEKFLDETLRMNPSFATMNGYHKYDGIMEDLSPGGIRGAVASYTRHRKEFAKIDPDSLSVSARIDLDLVANHIETNLFFLEELKPFQNDPSMYNDIIGFGTLFLTILDEDSPHWPARLESLLSRMRKIPAFLGQAKGNLKNPSPVLTGRNRTGSS